MHICLVIHCKYYTHNLCITAAVELSHWHMEKQEIEMKWKLETEMGTATS